MNAKESEAGLQLRDVWKGSSPAVKLRCPNVSSVVSLVLCIVSWLTLCCTNPRIPAPLDAPTATITKKLTSATQPEELLRT